MNKETQAEVESLNYDEIAGAKEIKTNEKNGFTLADMAGLEYDDAKWDKLLDQLSMDDMKIIVGGGMYQIPAIESIGFDGVAVRMFCTHFRRPIFCL